MWLTTSCVYLFSQRLTLNQLNSVWFAKPLSAWYILYYCNWNTHSALHYFKLHRHKEKTLLSWFTALFCIKAAIALWWKLTLALYLPNTSSWFSNFPERHVNELELSAISCKVIRSFCLVLFPWSRNYPTISAFLWAPAILNWMFTSQLNVAALEVSAFFIMSMSSISMSITIDYTVQSHHNLLFLLMNKFEVICLYWKSLIKKMPIVAIGKLKWQARKASHYGSKQQ